jgi:hypothetical protein
VNNNIYANSAAVTCDLRRQLKDGKRPPDAPTGEIVEVPVAGGVYRRYQVPSSRP